jgi:hypothetical protein
MKMIDVRTCRPGLGHESLATTQKYLALEGNRKTTGKEMSTAAARTQRRAKREQLEDIMCRP